MRARAHVWLLATLVGCGSASPGLATTELPAFDAEQRARVRALAPDLYARAVAVRELFVAATDVTVAREHAARAELLFEAAALEADRLALEARREALLREAGRHERARVTAIEAQRTLVHTQRLAALAAQPEPNAQLPARERQLMRARTLLAAAQALRAPAEALQLAENALLGAELDGHASGEAASRKPPADDPAERALAAAERALGAARARQPAPNTAEIAALAELGRERGLTVLALVQGSRVELPGAFAGASGTLTSRGREQLGAARGLLRAHPHGPVQLLAGSAAGRAALARALAAEGGTRLVVAEGKPGAAALGRGDAALLFQAYAAPAATTPNPP